MNPVTMEFRPVEQSLGVIIQCWHKIQISVVRNPNIRGPIQCPVVAPIVTPVVTKYSSLRRAQPYSLYSGYSELKVSIWSDTHIYTFSIYLKSSPSFCICSRMSTPLQNYLDHSSVDGVKTMSRLRVIYRRRRKDQRLCMPRWFHLLTIRQVLEYSRYNTMINTHQTI